MRKLVVTFVLFLVALFISPVKSNAESFLSGYVGVAIPHDSDFSTSTLSGTVSFNDGFSIGGRVGHWFNESNMPYLGLAVDANGRFPSTSTLNAMGTSISFSSDVTVFSLTANALLRYPGGNLRPYVGIGSGWFHADTGNIVIGATSFPGTSDDEFGANFFAGIDYLINPNISIFGEYKFSLANFSFSGLDVNYRESQLYAGLSYHF